MRLSISNNGYLWSSESSNCFQYCTKTNNNWKDFQIIKCECENRLVMRQQQRLKDKWVSTGFVSGYFDWGEWKELTSATPEDWSTPETLTNTSNNVYIDNNITGSIDNDSWRNSLMSNQRLRNFSITAGEIKPLGNTILDGYQVRCVKEKE